MSLCIRSLPNRFTSLVNTRKRVTKIDRQLPKHIRSSPFLEEFLGTPATGNATNHFKERVSEPAALHSLRKTLPVTSINTTEYCAERSKQRHNGNEERLLWLQHCGLQFGAKDIGVIRSQVKKGPTVTNKVLLGNTVERNGEVLRHYKFPRSHEDGTFVHSTEPLSLNRIFCNTPSALDGKGHKVEGTPLGNSEAEVGPKKNEKNLTNRPSKEQLDEIFEVLSKDLPKLFVKSMDYRIYTQDVVFVNNIRGVVTTNLLGYVKQMALLKVIGHVKFAYVKFEILKITVHEEDDTIKIRWRIRGVSGIKVLFTFWKQRLWRLRDTLKEQELWYDGFSTFYVNANGKVFKHVADKMMADQDVLEKAKEPPIEAKLALFSAVNSTDLFGLEGICSRRSLDSKLPEAEEK